MKHDRGRGGDVETEEEVARKTRGAYFLCFSCKKKEWLNIEFITLLEYVNNF
jgi:hypothetical protein